MKKSINHNPVGTFDDALPERLLGVSSGDTAGVKINLRAGEVEPSPYIVKLTRDAEAGQAVAAPVSDDPIAALAKSFIIEHDDVLDEAPLMLVQDDADGLSISLADLREQMRESERELESFEAPLVSLDATPSALANVPLVDIWSELQPLDVVAEFSQPEEVAEVHATVLESESEPGQEPEPVADMAWLTPSVEVTEGELVELPVAAQIKVWERPNFSLVLGHNGSWQRALVSFVCLALVAVAPLHAMQVVASAQADGGAIEAESKAALDTFLRGATSLSSEEFGNAGQDFAAAADNFADAETSLNNLHAGVALIASIIPQTDRSVDSVRALVTVGQELSQTAAIMSQAADELTRQQSLDLTGKLSLLGAYTENALPHAKAAEQALQAVDPKVVPAEYSEAIAQLMTQTPKLVSSMEEYVNYVDALSLMLGGEDKMRYLAVFQNNTELRPTGGFMGSFAEIDLEQGEVTRMLVPGGGTYDVQGQLRAFVAAPGPLQLLKARWEFQDANWFPDFPTSAKKLTWFYSQAGGPTTDGVVAVNATFVVELLRILGPVEMPKYNRTFDAENFIFETQKLVELEYDRTENVPKQVIGDLAPILLERVQEADVKTLLAVVEVVTKGLEQKDIQVHFRDNDLQAIAEELAWSGSLKQTSGDYLMVVNTNLGGGKTDGVINQDVQVSVDINEAGEAINTVTITKTHRGMKSDLFAGSNNVDYLRLYVPKGSELISADGFEIPDDSLFETPVSPLNVDADLELRLQNLSKDEASGTDIWEEDGKTVFGNWMQTASGETEVITFKYRTPISIFSTPAKQDYLARAKAWLGMKATGQYTMLIQKQSGVQSRETVVELNLPTGTNLLWTSASEQGLSYSGTNATDNFVSWLFEGSQR